MASSFYGLGRQKFAEGSIHWLTDDIRVVLVDTDDYSVSIDTDEFLADIPETARVKVSDAFTGKTATLGALDANDVTLSGVTGDESEALVIYKHTGDPATSPLLIYVDSYTGLVGGITPSGGPIVILWPNGGNKIGKL